MKGFRDNGCNSARQATWNIKGVITGVCDILVTVKKMILSFIQIIMNITLGQHHLLIVMNTILGQHHLMLSSVITTCFVIATISK